MFYGELCYCESIVIHVGVVDSNLKKKRLSLSSCVIIFSSYFVSSVFLQNCFSAIVFRVDFFSFSFHHPFFLHSKWVFCKILLLHYYNLIFFIFMIINIYFLFNIMVIGMNNFLKFSTIIINYIFATNTQTAFKFLILGNSHDFSFTFVG